MCGSFSYEHDVERHNQSNELNIHAENGTKGARLTKMSSIPHSRLVHSLVCATLI